ncbi:MAG: carboxypeptidase-like regulatory domain-containing protein [Caldilineaceae bacterium]
MNRYKLSVVLTFALIFVFVASGPARAAVYQLAGRVTNQSGSPLVDVTVEVIDPATSTTVASAATDANGNYALSVDEGTYDVRVTTPAGIGLVSTLTLGKIINSALVLDFVLVPAGTVTLRGRLLDPQGSGISGQRITLIPTNGGSSILQITDSLGDYRLR